MRRKFDDKSSPKRVYVMHDGMFSKIGVADDVERRLAAIKATNPCVVLLYTSWPTEIWRTIEMYAHKQLAEYRVHGEWFYVAPDKAIAAVHTAFEIPSRILLLESGLAAAEHERTYSRESNRITGNISYAGRIRMRNDWN